jgi:DNA-binding XRE family transcriptional regulator
VRRIPDDHQLSRLARHADLLLRSPACDVDQRRPAAVVISIRPDAEIQEVSQPERVDLDGRHRRGVAGQHGLVHVRLLSQQGKGFARARQDAAALGQFVGRLAVALRQRLGHGSHGLVGGGQIVELEGVVDDVQLSPAVHRRQLAERLASGFREDPLVDLTAHAAGFDQGVVNVPQDNACRPGILHEDQCPIPDSRSIPGRRAAHLERAPEMDDQLAQDVGERVRFRRAANHQTQVVVAGLAGITADYLYQIERGKKLPTLPVLMALAQALRVEPGDLLSPPSNDRRSNAPLPAVGLRHAMSVPPVSGEPMPMPDLRRQVDAAWQLWQTSPTRYSRMQHILGDLITEVERAQRADVDAGAVVEAHALAADLYGLTRTVAKRTGHTDLSALAAERAQRAAEAARDPLRLGAARWNAAHAMLAQGHHGVAEDLALTAADELGTPPGADAAAIRGSLLLVASIAAAHAGEFWTARDRLRTVEPMASKTGERNVHWTVFGPTNVSMYAVSIEILAGEATEADVIAASVSYEQSPSIERRMAFLIDQAQSHLQRRDYGGALVLLREGGQEAPEDLSHRPLARQLLSTVIQRAGRTISREAAALARQYGVPAA